MTSSPEQTVKYLSVFFISPTFSKQKRLSKHMTSSPERTVKYLSVLGKAHMTLDPSETLLYSKVISHIKTIDFKTSLLQYVHFIHLSLHVEKSHIFHWMSLLESTRALLQQTYKSYLQHPDQSPKKMLWVHPYRYANYCS